MKGGIEAVVSASIKSLTSSLAKVIMRGNISSHDSPLLWDPDGLHHNISLAGHDRHRIPRCPAGKQAPCDRGEREMKCVTIVSIK